MLGAGAECGGRMLRLTASLVVSGRQLSSRSKPCQQGCGHALWASHACAWHSQKTAWCRQGGGAGAEQGAVQAGDQRHRRHHHQERPAGPRAAARGLGLVWLPGCLCLGLGCACQEAGRLAWVHVQLQSSVSDSPQQHLLFSFGLMPQGSGHPCFCTSCLRTAYFRLLGLRAAHKGACRALLH